MTGEQCFEIWAPIDGVWSPWAKPVLFAQLAQRVYQPPQPGALVDVFWAPSPGRTAIIVDLPGGDAVACGLALATRGYRPVPLFNTSLGPAAVVDAVPIATGLVHGAERLKGLHLPADAPPAFLLDANRMTPAVLPEPGKFDNRWMVFPQDFPSGSRLRAGGLSDALLLHGEKGLQEDLAHVLLRWQQLGIRLQARDSSTGGAMRQLKVEPPSMFRLAWYRVLTMAGLRRNNAGGFGAVVPVPSSGGHG